MAVENIIDINPLSSYYLWDELNNDVDFIYEVVMNNGANLLLYLSADLRNAITLQFVLKYFKQYIS